MAPPRVRDRFTSRDPRIEMIPESGCWIWMGAITQHGYGRVWVHREHPFAANKAYAHRAVWVTSGRTIPDGYVLDHVCRERSCVNPDHLRAVTKRVNAIENSLCFAAINASKDVCGVCGGEYTRGRLKRTCVACTRKAVMRYHRKTGRVSGRGAPKTETHKQRLSAALSKYWSLRKMGAS